MDKFIEWLKLHTPLTERTIKEYASAFKRIADNLAQSNSIELFSEDVKDLKDLQKIKENYFSIEENKNTDKRSNGRYSAAFNKFIDFQEFQKSTPISDEGGIVYILSNPAMPGLVKIGKTGNLDSRMRSLFSSGVPLPFRCVYAKKVKNYSDVEHKLHGGLKSVRENLNREFFRIPGEDVINLLKMMPGEDVTPKEDHFEDKEDQVAFEKATRIGQRFNFEMIGIKSGSILNFAGDDSITCTVSSKNKVMFDGEDHSLSSAALIAKNKMGFNWKTIAGPMHWKYEGEVLDERRKRYEEGED